MDFAGYLRFLTQMGEQLIELSGIEQEKVRAVQSGDLNALDGCIRREQAMGLTFRGLEQRREGWIQELNLPDGSLRRLPELCPPELRQEAAQTVETVLRQYEVCRSARESARTVLECELHRVERQLAQKGWEPGEAETALDQLPPGLRTDFRA